MHFFEMLPRLILALIVVTSPVVAIFVMAGGATRREEWKHNPIGEYFRLIGRILGKFFEEQEGGADYSKYVKQNWPNFCQAAGWATAQNVPRFERQRQGSVWDTNSKVKTVKVAERVFTYPTIVNIEENATGVVVIVRPLDGQTLATFAKGASAVSMMAGVPVTVRQGPPGHVAIRLQTGDALQAPAQASSSLTAIPQTFSRPPALPIGRTEQGGPWNFITGEMALIGGVPGSGKSATLNSIILEASRFPAIQMAMIDLKGGVEAALVEPRLSAVAADYDEAEAVTARLCAVMDARLARMREAGVRYFGDIGFTPATPLLVLIIDEAAELFATVGSSKEDRALAASIERNVSRLVRLSRAAGFLVIAATQKPTVDAIPSQVRDQLQNRIALRCVTGEQARVILGASSEEKQHLVTSIREDQRGYAVVEENGEPTYARARFVEDEQVRQEIEQTKYLARPLTDVN